MNNILLTIFFVILIGVTLNGVSSQSNQEVGRRIVEKSSLAALIIDDRKNQRITRSKVARSTSVPLQLNIDPVIYNSISDPLEATDAENFAQIQIRQTTSNGLTTPDCELLLQFETSQQVLNFLRTSNDTVTISLIFEDVIESTQDLRLSYITNFPDGYNYSHILTDVKQGINVIGYTALFNRDLQPNNPNSFYKLLLENALLNCKRSSPINRFLNSHPIYKRNQPCYLLNQRYRLLRQNKRLFGFNVPSIILPGIGPIINDVRERFEGLVKTATDIAKSPIAGITGLVLEVVQDAIIKTIENFSLTAKTTTQLIEIIQKTRDPITSIPVLTEFLVSQLDIIRFGFIPIPDSINPTVPFFRAVAKIAIGFSHQAFDEVTDDEKTIVSTNIVKDPSPPQRIDAICAVSVNDFYFNCIEVFGSFAACQLLDRETCAREPLQTIPEF